MRRVASLELTIDRPMDSSDAIIYRLQIPTLDFLTPKDIPIALFLTKIGYLYALFGNSGMKRITNSRQVAVDIQ